MFKKGANTCKVKLQDGREVCFSYGVIVAAFVPGRGYLRTSHKWSVTSSKHANAFAGNDATKVEQKELEALCLPLVSR